MKFGSQVRRVINTLNGSTLLGLALAKAGRSEIRRGPEGLILGDNCKLPFPNGSAFTVGNVVMVLQQRNLCELEECLPDVMQHEARHATQWAVLGPLFLPAYVAAVGWSWLRTGNPGSLNYFERNAGLDLGGYEHLTGIPLTWTNVKSRFATLRHREPVG